MNEQFPEHEELLLKSWDGAVSAKESERLSALIQKDPLLRKQRDQYIKIRELLLRSESDSFGPFFAERIIHIIKQRANEIDYQIFLFFKKYQLILLGIVVALLATNILLADEFSLKALFGLDEEPAKDIFFIDVYEKLAH